MKFFIHEDTNKVDIVTDWLIANVGPATDRRLGHWIGNGWSIEWYGPTGGLESDKYEVIVKDPEIATLAMLRFKQG